MVYKGLNAHGNSRYINSEQGGAYILYEFTIQELQTEEGSASNTTWASIT